MMSPIRMNRAEDQIDSKNHKVISIVLRFALSSTNVRVNRDPPVKLKRLPEKGLALVKTRECKSSRKEFHVKCAVSISI